MGTRGSGILVPVPPRPGSSVPVDDDTFPPLRNALNRVFRPTGGDLTRDLPLLFAHENHGNLRVVTEADSSGRAGLRRIVAHAGFLRREALVYNRRIRVACVGAVFVAEDRRGQGIATQLLSDLLKDARREADLVIVSGDRGLYRREGFDPIPPLARFRIPQGLSNVARIQVRDVTAGDIDTLIHMHDATDVRFIRTAEDWTRLIEAGVLVDVPARLSLILRDQRPVGFVAAQRTVPRMDGTMRPRRILEVAGDREAILDAAPLLAEEMLLPRYATGTIDLAEQRGWIRTTRQFLITAEALTADVIAIPWLGLNYV